MIDMHNHTDWSDGEDSIENIVLNALNRGVSKIGISDHYNTRKCPSVPRDNLSKYLSAINSIKVKYKDKITVLSGIEISSLRYPTSFEEIPIDVVNKFDYILIEYLDLLAPKTNLDSLKAFLSKITCKKGLAHTDLIKLSNKFESMEETIQFLKDNDIYWELNSSSSCDALYNVTERNKETEDIINLLKLYNIEIIPGSDTHSLSDYEFGRLKRANDFITNLKNEK